MSVYCAELYLKNTCDVAGCFHVCISHDSDPMLVFELTCCSLVFQKELPKPDVSIRWLKYGVGGSLYQVSGKKQSSSFAQELL
ncbi:hypothetical protein ScPMuIL_013220 [Solemya velum]